MAYRFVLDVPTAVEEDAKAIIATVKDAQILVERHPRDLAMGAEPRAELSVAAHSLQVLDTLYGWIADRGLTQGIFIRAYEGGQLDLATTDASTLRRLVQGDQYWFQYTVPRIQHVARGWMEGGARVADVPYGGREATDIAVLTAENRVDLGGVDHVAVRVRDMRLAERFYNDFLGMDVLYRARRVDDRWQHYGPDFSWDESIATGVVPDIIRLQNAPVALLLINAGAPAVLHEARVAYVSLNAPQSTLDHLRGRVLFNSWTLQEDSPRSMRFVDPFGITWQIVSND